MSAVAAWTSLAPSVFLFEYFKHFELKELPRLKLVTQDNEPFFEEFATRIEFKLVSSNEVV